ncbi:response regulator transcription factor [Sphaerisporangium perillae]|uniref:response regulator transcription factor n=1 Tax=Sphaerisporangium perillae TaxID=2935860 RepID=UPI00200D3C38|nr:response regulator transcription factor [Sphaerisporangium perillae]
MTIRVLLADDHPVYMEGLRMLLGTIDGMEVVGAAVDGASLVDLADQVDADVAVVDLDMPGMDGATASALLRERHPDLDVLVLTMHEEEAMVIRALRAGVRGYVLKSAGPGAIARAIQTVAEGDTVLGGGVGTWARTAAARASATGPFPELSTRETEILDLVARGLSNPQIAQRLFISVKTVGNHLSNILTKLSAASRAEAVARARDAGLGTDSRA